jgi:(2Fe-2S) ferredoxin
MKALAQVGFDRPKSAPLPGTVTPYRRHLLVCTGRTAWPAQITNTGGFIQALSEACAADSAGASLTVKVSACDDPSSGPGSDVLAFPDNLRYRGLDEADIPALLAGQVGPESGLRQPQSVPLAGQHLCVCVHEMRDPRCGYCGPILFALFSQELVRRGLERQVALHRTSHLGGHEYAGNVIVYPSGDWYGYVTPADVARIVETHILHGQVVKDRWRGRMGLTREEQRAQAEAW